jgi:iron(II)-dependent oxidoreductase
MKHLLIFCILLSVAIWSRTSVAEQPAQSQSGPGSIPEINGMVYIPPGEFLMGSTVDDLKKQADIDEFPQHGVYVKGFYIDRYEVTNIQYKIFVDSMKVKPPYYWWDNNYPVGMDGYPVVSVNWHDARRYAEFVGKRLPTETEWEKAARGADARRYPWGDAFDNARANNGAVLARVAEFESGISPYGVFNMAGNAAEWVDAWYAPYERGEHDRLDEDMPEYKPYYGTKRYRVYRGGSWNSFGKYLRCANREKARPKETWGYIGFRCAKDAPQTSAP